MNSSQISSNAVNQSRHSPTVENGNFIYTLVHEIRNPLTNIKLATEVLEHLATDDNSKMYLNMIMRNSERIKGIITQLLGIRNTNEMMREEQSMHSLIEEVLMMNEDRTRLKNVAIRKNYTRHDFRININRTEVIIALTNLIINAIEAMPLKNGLLEITTKLLHGICVIIITDNGTGISEENQTNAFKPYFTTKPDGFGLGLSNTLSLLKSNRIGVIVRSELGKGTRFILLHKKELA